MKLKNNKIKISQFTAGFYVGDAIANEALTIKKILKDNGVDSEIYTNLNHTSQNDQKYVKDYNSYKSDSSENIIIYHYAIHSPVSKYLRGIKAKKILRYHNVTPYEYFTKINPQLAKELKQGREELSSLKNDFEYSLSVSDYNRAELNAMGFRNLSTIPIITDFLQGKIEPDKKILNLKQNEKGTIIFVGRIVPNKCQEDLIKVFYFYKKYLNKKARMFLVGGWGSAVKYYYMLQGLIKILKLEDIYFTGHISDSELAGYYNISDLFLSMSEHEGFGVPLIEAMFHHIPIIAYKKAGVPETLGNSGILITEKNYMTIAELIDYIMSDDSFREKIISQQSLRLKDFSIEKQTEKFINILNNIISKD